MFNLIIYVCVLMSFTGCATIMHGTKQSVGISSNPTNASVWIDRSFVGKTPVILELTRKEHHLLRIELEGFQPYETTFSKQISHWVIGNIVFGGVIGLAVDAIAGGLYVLTPDQVQAELRSNNITADIGRHESYIAVVLHPNPSWQKIGNLESN